MLLMFAALTDQQLGLGLDIARLIITERHGGGQKDGISV